MKKWKVTLANHLFEIPITVEADSIEDAIRKVKSDFPDTEDILEDVFNVSTEEAEI